MKNAIIKLLVLSAIPITGCVEQMDEPEYKLEIENGLDQQRVVVSDSPQPILHDLMVQFTKDGEPIQGEKILISSSTHPELVLGNFGITNDTGLTSFLFIFDTSHVGKKIFLTAIHDETGTESSTTLNIN